MRLTIAHASIRQTAKRAVPAAIAVCAVAASVATGAVPTLVTAHRISTPKGALKAGKTVGSARLGVRVFANASNGFALANVADATYPAATTDGGKTWKIDGPPLHVNAAQAPLVVTQVGAHKRTYFAWGGPGGGPAVDVSPDAGKHWWGALLGGIVLSVVSTSNGHLVASTQSPAGSSGQKTENSVYVSKDGGHHWRLSTKFGSF